MSIFVFLCDKINKIDYVINYVIRRLFRQKMWTIAKMLAITQKGPRNIRNQRIASWAVFW